MPYEGWFFPHCHSSKVRYRSGMTHGNNKKNFEIFTPEEFIAAITEHIPDKHSRIGVRDKLQMVSYYGWYSSRSRGERIKAGLFRPGDEPTSSVMSPEVTVLDLSDHRPRRVPSKTWWELIKKIWEVDPLRFPRCGHEMKIISPIHELDVIERILRHLGLWKQPPDPHEGKIKAPADGPVVLIILTMAGPDMKSPSSSTTKRHRWTDPPPATAGAVCSQIRGIQPLSRPPQSRQRAR